MHIKTIEFKTDNLIEPFDWIDPNNIEGYSPAELKQENLKSYLNPAFIDSHKVTPDVNIAEYYQQWFNQEGDIIGYVNITLWMIINLYSSYAGFSCSSHLKQLNYIPRESAFINTLFERITSVMDEQEKNQDYHAYKLIRVFLFELFQYGSEWGVFVVEQDKPSVIVENMTVKQAKKYDYICSYLNDTNLTKLDQIEAFDKVVIPSCRYS